MNTNRKSLPRSLVDFAWILEPFVRTYPGLLYNTVDQPNLRDTTLPQMLAVLVRAGRCHPIMKGCGFTPILVDWKLPKGVGKYDDGKFKDAIYCYHNRMFGVANYTTWTQSDYPESNISVITNESYIDEALRFLAEINRYKHTTDEPLDVLYKQGLAVSLEQARIVCHTLIQRYDGLGTLTGEFIQPGKSIFVLVKYTSFLGENGAPDERLKGKEQLMWMEVRCLSKIESRAFEVTYHPDLRIRIPKDSLIVLGNLDWFSGIK